ncbi:hypothetical protein [Paraglaciecola sp. 25GB23A]
MSNIVRGIIAGFAATVVLSLLMMAKSMMGAGVAVGWVFAIQPANSSSAL